MIVSREFVLYLRQVDVVLRCNPLLVHFVLLLLLQVNFFLLRLLAGNVTGGSGFIQVDVLQIVGGLLGDGGECGARLGR